jgi:hypothetical protein
MSPTSGREGKGGKGGGVQNEEGGGTVQTFNDAMFNDVTCKDVVFNSVFFLTTWCLMTCF